MRRSCAASFFALAVVAAGCADESPTAAAASDPAFAASGTPVDASRNAIDVAVIGDVPYGTEATMAFPGFIQSINRDRKVRRAIHVGDIKSGKHPLRRRLVRIHEG